MCPAASVAGPRLPRSFPVGTSVMLLSGSLRSVRLVYMGRLLAELLDFISGALCRVAVPRRGGGRERAGWRAGAQLACEQACELAAPCGAL
jgi:hypothetical protein